MPIIASAEADPTNWKRGRFAWEYKEKDKHKTLNEAYRQVYQYRDALDNPPLTITCEISGLVSPSPTIRPDLVKIDGSISFTLLSRRIDWK